MTGSQTFSRLVLARAVILFVAGAIGAGVVKAQAWHEVGLAAFDTVWQTIHETYYDPAFGGLDWDAVRRELRPHAAQARSADEQRVAIREMLARLGQSHFALLGATPDADGPRGPASVPFDVRVTSAGLIVTRTHAASDVPVGPGDRISHIDGRDVEGLLGGVAADDPRREEVAWRLVMRALSGEASEPVRLVVQAPGGTPRPVSVARVPAPGEDVILGNLPALRAHLEAVERHTPSGRRVGVIRFNVWMATIGQPFADAVDRFRASDGLIIDLRGNPGGLADMIRGIAGHFVNEAVVLGRMRMRGLDLEFRVNPRRSTLDGRTVEPYAGPVALLVDGLTASASECFAGGLQAIGRVRVFGTRTAGQALPAATRRLASGDVLMYAVGDFVTSTGQRLEGAGVRPDEVVTLSPETLARGHDAEAAALGWIDRGAAAR